VNHTIPTLRLLSGLALLGVTATTPLAAQFDGIAAEIRRIIEEEGVPSMSVAVARDGKIVWEAGFGVANKETGLRATAHTPYSLASISKPITATGLMILVERGFVDLDRPINDYLGEAKVNGRAGDAAQATVRRVANHSSGLPLHYQFFYEDEPYRRPPMDETIRRYANLVTAPGERYQYSNLGYGLIDYLIARRADMSYPDFLRREVFEPLGMHRSAVDVPPGIEDEQAVRYAADGTAVPFYDFDHPGGSAVYASAHDLVRFAMFHLGDAVDGQRRIISEASRRAMQRPTMVTGPNRGYGIGWATRKSEAGVELVSHTGGMGGVATSLTLVPAFDIAVAVLTNSSSRWPHVVAQNILEAMLPGRVTMAETDDGERSPELALLRGTWSGTVVTHQGNLPLMITIAGDSVTARFGRMGHVPVEEISFEDGYFRGRFPGTFGTPDVERREYRVQLDLRLRGDILNGSAIAQSTPGNRVGNALTHWAELRKR